MLLEELPTGALLVPGGTMLLVELPTGMLLVRKPVGLAWPLVGMGRVPLPNGGRPGTLGKLGVGLGLPVGLLGWVNPGPGASVSPGCVVSGGVAVGVEVLMRVSMGGGWLNSR
jgi:hypothetical protein